MGKRSWLAQDLAVADGATELGLEVRLDRTTTVVTVYGLATFTGTATLRGFNDDLDTEEGVNILGPEDGSGDHAIEADVPFSFSQSGNWDRVKLSVTDSGAGGGTVSARINEAGR